MMFFQAYPAAFPAVLATALVLGGCVNPPAAFEDFQRRYEEREGQGGAGGGGTGGCIVPDAGEADGDFLFVFTPAATPTTPVLFASTVTTVGQGADMTLSFSYQAVNATDRTTPVGQVFNVGPYPVEADGRVLMPLPIFALHPDGNPYNTLELTVETSLEGMLCRGAQLCGTITGAVIDPLQLPLDESTFTFAPPVDGVYPEPPPTNCAGDLADPLMEE